ncbi:glycine rich protein [Archangium gephyra]|uniref:Glycine rich protein n=2 Tax=Archangium gephyra TaxID=48 RepID=A0ABX9JT14_9BACT|nr:glycine-rich protein [Archangium gephyra]REG26613.1 glycine rich protein [Archangium gephyra]
MRVLKRSASHAARLSGPGWGMGMLLALSFSPSALADTTLTATGAVQSFTVPATGYYTIEVAGAQGGASAYGGSGGLGAKVKGQFYLTSGSVLQVVVGKRPAGTVSRYDGGGGGGGTFVYKSATATPLPATPMLVAGGGGGGYGLGGSAWRDGVNSSGAGGLNGNGGQGGVGNWTYGGGGGTGWVSTGGGGSSPSYTGGGQRWTGGAGSSYGGNIGSPGGFGGGGGGGECNTCGGGGGGYSGGGGGSQGNYEMSGGGGGSYNSGRVPLNLAAVNTGDGYVWISDPQSAVSWTGAPTSTTFNAVGSCQNYTVPITGTYVLEAAGAQGGASNFGGTGGLGARMRGEFSLTQGQVVQVVVGARPPGPRGQYDGGAGGGGTFAFVGSSCTTLPSLPLIVAGGGGGGSGSGATTAQNGLNGAAAGGTNGAGGSASGTNFYYTAAGGTGWLSGGANGSSPIYAGGGQRWYGGRGTSYGGHYGSWGGFGGGGAAGDQSTGGGGGGGYSGGGGGSQTLASGGGGGSYNAGANPLNTPAVQTGHGYLTITYQPPMCAHSEYEEGEGLDPLCSSCASTVCGIDEMCCTSSWDAVCVGIATDACGTP